MSRNISLAQADAIIEACGAEAVSVGQPMNIAVVDDGGNLVAFATLDDTKLIEEDISQRRRSPPSCSRWTPATSCRWCSPAPLPEPA